MKLIGISDTHGRHKRLDLPDGDILIHAGDFSQKGEEEEIRHFLDWFAKQPHAHKILIAGNHDFMAEDNPDGFRALVPKEVVYLNDEGHSIDDYLFWGSPITPRFHNWAFNRDRGSDIAQHWALIPQHTDVLITHGPPRGYGDRTFFGKRVGCSKLLDVVEHIKPQIHLFGHIHEARGQYNNADTSFYNLSNAAFVGRRIYPAVEIELS